MIKVQPLNQIIKERLPGFSGVLGTFSFNHLVQIDINMTGAIVKQFPKCQISNQRMFVDKGVAVEVD
jgi:hypothetical protein